ncbi:MAG: putative O-glycosylation ligase, exosortase A system-associated [Nitrospirae bacterium]|nr:putative O-glycosylation ligase, exosortase A system-associated [Magnetococcales bacterium]HAT51467.1 putative O-glycosylation ligase, exosortase A system-associated [Alphaproteobacteria bacterium]
MRDLLLTLIVFGSLPVIFVRPHYGVYMWAWLTYMTPHRLAWGFAYDFRFNYIVAIVTLIAAFRSKETKIRIPLTLPSVLWMLFISWTTLTAYNAFEPYSAWQEWDRFIKIQIMVIVTYVLIKEKEHLIILVGVITFSIGFFGVKGGIFTLLRGGHFRVMGPEYSFISDNNTFALALNMVLPLSLYFMHTTKHNLVRLALLGVNFLCIMAIFGSYSRGGLVGLTAMGVVFWITSRKKIASLAILVILIPSGIMMMPEKWVLRVTPMIESLNLPFLKETIKFYPASLFSYDLQTELSLNKNTVIPLTESDGLIRKDAEILQDLSVMGRFDAWAVAKAIAADRPFLGGGFGAFSQGVFNHYTPGVYRHDAHSIYFEVLGEQGYAGLVIWVLMHLTSLNYGRWIIMRCRKDTELYWASVMAKMIILGLLGYYGAGFSLGLAYYDLPYHYVTILVILRLHIQSVLDARKNMAQKIKRNSLLGRTDHIFPVPPKNP